MLYGSLEVSDDAALSDIILNGVVMNDFVRDDAVQCTNAHVFEVGTQAAPTARLLARALPRMSELEACLKLIVLFMHL